MSENGRELRSTAGARMKGIIKDILADSDNETENQSGEDSEPNKNGAIPQPGVLRDNVSRTILDHRPVGIYSMAALTYFDTNDVYIRFTYSFIQ
ncbi:hypothetical protein SNE40_015063 [Patella caerulea]|uniref:Uncharacterized protein n=1 Tax=Patella caerulea TaxID=87958 RepID=A0AAN8JG56_PATCE